jgi:hypothetical protein
MANLQMLLAALDTVQKMLHSPTCRFTMWKISWFRVCGLRFWGLRQVAACTPEPILPEAQVGAALQGERLYSMAGSLPFLAGLTHPILHMSPFPVRNTCTA